MGSIPQPQWGVLDSVRPYNYTHTQPQWAETLSRADWADANSGSEVPPVVRRVPLPPKMLCATCRFTKQSCNCRRCAVCRESVGSGRRHHCRACWRAVCSRCFNKERHVYILGALQRVCDNCAVPWALASLTKRQEDKSLFWGLYVLRRAGEMPCLCINPDCLHYTYFSSCYHCQTPTVMTHPHVERLVRAEESKLPLVSMLNKQQFAQRTREVNAYGPEEVEATFRQFFPHYEELQAFRDAGSSTQVHDLLLAFISAAISYEYGSAPCVTLQLSDVPYARLLKIRTSTNRYSVLEAPGRVKFFAFPGTHDLRTRMIDINISQTVRTVTLPCIAGVNREGRPIHDGVRRVGSYCLHGGFAREAADLQVETKELVTDLLLGYRLVFTGHSLGGAIAQLIAIELLAYLSDVTIATTLREAGITDPASRIMCVSLGSPLVGNYQLAEYINLSNWARCFHHLVYRTDIVPRLCCGDELTWDAAAQVVERLGEYYSNVQGWFTWRRALGSAAESGEGAGVLEDFVDTSIRTGRVVLTGDEEPGGPSEEQRVPHVRHTAQSLERRVHRRFACFGRYHFLEYGSQGYVSTRDGELAFNTLKQGAGLAVRLLDHSVSSYNCGIMIRLYGGGRG